MGGRERKRMAEIREKKNCRTDKTECKRESESVRRREWVQECEERARKRMSVCSMNAREWEHEREREREIGRKWVREWVREIRDKRNSAICQDMAKNEIFQVSRKNPFLSFFVSSKKTFLKAMNAFLESTTQWIFRCLVTKNYQK